LADTSRVLLDRRGWVWMIGVVSEPSGSWEPRLATAEARIEELAAGQAEVVAMNTRLRRVIADAAERHEAELGAAQAERDRANRRVGELGLSSARACGETVA